jgi:folate-dependent phosphoribosylglycinamide formyltransferase PurN
LYKKLLNISGNALPGAAVFMSGSGSNAERLIQSVRESSAPSWEVRVIVTDAPLKSRAVEIAERFGLPVIKHDISEFYRSHGETRVSIKTEKGREIREKWTDCLRSMLSAYEIDFGVLAGFVPLCNITGDFPCLNVHPGDLTYEEDGRRILVGLHTVPVELAILRGLESMRSSVIIAQPYTGKGDNMDSGPILGVSAPAAIDLQGHSPAELAELAASRPEKRPKGGYADTLEKIAEHNQEKLKINGDWIVFPPVVEDFASGRFATDEKENLFYSQNGSWIPVKTVEYDGKDKKLLR